MEYGDYQYYGILYMSFMLLSLSVFIENRLCYKCLWRSMNFRVLSIMYYKKGRKLSCYSCYNVYIGLNSQFFFSWCRTPDGMMGERSQEASLSDLRIRSRPGEDEANMIKGFGKILRSVCKILIFSKLTILLAILQSRPISITNFVLPRRSQHFSNHQESNRIADTWIICARQSEKHPKWS